MKSLSIIIGLFFFTSLVFSQGKIFRVEAGLNQSWFNYEVEFINDLKSEFKPQITFGLHYNLYSFDNFIISAGLRYYNLFRYLNISLFGHEDPALLTTDNYLISVPVQISYKLDFINTNVILNIEPSHIIQSKIKSPGNNIPVTLEIRDITNEMNRVQFGAGIGLEYVVDIFNERFGIKSIYSFGLTTIPQTNKEFKNSSGTYTWVGYKTTELVLLITYYF